MKNASAIFCLWLLTAGVVLGQGGQLFDEHYLPQVRELLKLGDYRTVEMATAEAVERGEDKARWKMLRLQALAATGKREELREELTAATAAHPDDLPLLMLAHDLWLTLREKDEADAILKGFNAVALKKPLKDRSAAELVALGRGAFALGAEPARVLEEFYGAAKKKDPALLEGFLAAGNLALKKYDYARAAKEFREGLKQDAQDPDLRFGLARALFPGDRDAAILELDKTLRHNERHSGALVLKSEHLINGERHEEAEPLLQRALRVDEQLPEAWALKSVIAIMARNDSEGAAEDRERALEAIPENPEVEHLIGRCLSHRYRFADGALHQRQALEWEPGFNAAKMQLSNDLMRLGQEEEAWRLAEEVHDADPWNVLAYNYTKLREQLEAYETVRTDDFVIRMHPHELKIYGERALEILTEAHAILTKKYGLERLDHPTLVEFFAEQQDFAIRTFGELGGAGYLGVCFGPVITINSPGSSASGFSNWEATLWHEFCHVVTLTATRNRMPRWLSEGISVHEERVRMPQWGQHMTPAWRRRILETEGGLTPIGELSSAFLNASTGEDLMFAYFQSSMVVEFLLEEYGQEAFNALLAELAEGTPINAAIEEHTEKLDDVEGKFVFFAHDQAESFGPDVDWSIPEEVDPRDSEQLSARLKENPRNFQLRQWYTVNRLESEDWAAAKESARQLIDLLPEYAGEGNGYALLARAHQQLGETEEESAVLRDLAGRSADAVEAYQRLLEIDLEKRNWAPLLVNAERQMAVNPFVKQAHYCRACAARELDQPEEAIDSFNRLLHLGPENPAEVHFQLSDLYQERDPDLAKKHVLDALMEAPRYREAHGLLLKLNSPAPIPAPEEVDPGKPASDAEKPEAASTSPEE